MLTGDQQNGWDADRTRHLAFLDSLVRDPSGIPPLCDEELFAEIVDGMVADCAPRLFAVVEEFGDRVDGRITAWGMAFEDSAEVVGVGRSPNMSLRSAEDAAGAYSFGTRIKARLVWVNPDAATGIDEDADPDDETSG
jgi:hypothetical protein